MKHSRIFGNLFAILLMIAPSFAYAVDSVDMVLSAGNVRFSSTTFLEGKAVRIYASASNPSNGDVRGVIRFFDGGNQIQGDQPVSLLAGKDDSVFVDWVPAAAGEHNIRITVVPFEKTDPNQSNNTYNKAISVLADTDRDGVPNSTDTDDDNDKVPDAEDAFPLNKNESVDTDGDGIGNTKDDDDDNDGVKDPQDAFPLDPNERLDTDKDGIGDSTDTDDDNDGFTDTEEASLGTNPTLADTDGDSVNDKLDAYPLDVTQAHDYDRDGISDAKDDDADNDGIPKTQDVNDTNLGPQIMVTSFGGSKTRFSFPGEPVQFEADQSTDPDGSIQSVQWKLDSADVVGAAIQENFDSPGKHTVTVRVTDDKGEFREVSFGIRVIPAYLPWVIIPILLLLIILAIFWIFSYSKLRRLSGAGRRSRFESVIEVLKIVNKAIPKAKKTRKARSKK